MEVNTSEAHEPGLERASRVQAAIVLEGVLVFQLVLPLQHHFRLWGIQLLDITPNCQLWTHEGSCMFPSRQ